jgi:hypothetical protein
MALVILLINSALAVHWHRYILLDEVPGTFDTLRLNGKVWRYFGNTLLIILSTMIGSIIAAIPFILIALGTGTPQLVPLATMLAVLIVISFCFLRLGIKLPSIALGIPDFRFSDAWRVSAGNAFRISALFLVPIATAIIVTLIVKAADQSGVFAFVVLVFILQLAINWFLTFFMITLLTSLYGFFVQNRNF